MAASETFADAKRQGAIEHVLTATRRYVLANGLDATMDQLAEAAGVSRRTLFRLFGNRERLIADGFAAAIDAFGRRLPAYDGDLEGWLRATCESAHRQNDAAGPGYWAFTSRTDLPPELAAQQQKRRRDVRRAMSRTANTLWRARGGEDDAPDSFVTEVATFLSAHFTAAVVSDGNGRWQDAASLSYDGIVAALDRQVRVAEPS